MTEWRDVPGWEGLYRVSDDGQVWSVRRGRCITSQPIGNHRPGREPSEHAHRGVQLWRNCKRANRLVHRLMLEAFVGPCPEGMEACHLNDVGDDNRLENLRWDTKISNSRDAMRNGRNRNTNKDRCNRGHVFDDKNTRTRVSAHKDGTPTVHRECKRCSKDRRAALRSAARELERISA